MPLHHARKGDASPSDQSVDPSPAHEAGRDDRPFNFPGLPPEMRWRTAMFMHPHTLDAFEGTSKENYLIVTRVEEAARKVALEEADKTAADIYDAALPGPLPNVRNRIGHDDPHTVTAFEVADIVGHLVKRLDEKRQKDFADKLAKVDARVQADCFTGLEDRVCDFKEPNRSQLLDQAIELFGSNNNNSRLVAETIAVAEAKGILTPQHEAQIKEICERSNPIIESDLEEYRKLLGPPVDARQLLDDAKAIKDDPRKRLFTLAEAANSLTAAVQAAIKDPGLDKKRLSAVFEEAEKTAAEIYDAAASDLRSSVSWKVATNSGARDRHNVSAQNVVKVSAPNVVRVVGPLVKLLDDKRQKDFADKLAEADPQIQAEYFRALEPHLDGYRQPHRGRLLNGAIKLLESDNGDTRSHTAEAIVKAEARGVLTLEHDARIKEICGHNDEARSALENWREKSRGNRDARELLAGAEAIEDNPKERIRILAEAAERLEVDFRSADRRMETYRRRQDQSEHAPDRKRGRDANAGAGLSL